MPSRLQIQGDDSVLTRVTHSNIKSFSADVRLSLQDPFDPHRTPGDHKNCVARFPEPKISHKGKVLAFEPDASPHMKSPPELDISSAVPYMTRSLQINESSHFLQITSSQINHPSTTLELRPMNINFTVVDDGQKKTDIMNKAKDMSLFERKRSPPEIPDVIRGYWTPEEDRLLEQLVENYGVVRWSQIAQRLNGRAAKQCRERWHNHLRPDIKKGTFTEEEEQILVNTHRQLGNKWSKIAKKMPGRSENAIKNHWNASKRKMLTLSRKKNKNKNDNDNDNINNNNNHNNNSPLQCYIWSVISNNVSVEGRPLCGPTLQTPYVLNSEKCSLVKNREVNDQVVPTHCNGGGHSSVGMETTCSRDEGSTSMPKDWLYGYKPVKKNMGIELCNEKKHSSIGMEGTCSREEGSTSMPKHWLYGYKPVKKNMGTELCNEKKQSSIGMEGTCSREEGSTSMPKHWLYGYKPVEKNMGTELCKEKKQSDSKKGSLELF